MVKVLHIGLSSNPGGVENLVLNYHKNMNKQNIMFDYLDIYGEGIAFDEEIQKLGSTIYQIPNYKKHFFHAVKALDKILEDNYFDILHIHMQSAANLMPVFVGLKHKNLKIICHSHSSSTPKGLLRRFLNRTNVHILRRLNVKKWACGEKAGYWMWGTLFVPNNVIPNAVDYNKFKRNEAVRIKMRKRCFFSSDDIVIGFVGRFGDEKNTMFLIKVLKELKKLSCHYKLLTVGGNGLYNDFFQNIIKEELDDSFFSAGIQSDSSVWYQAMDAFLLPSLFEGFPVVAVEAQAAGIPCYLSDRITKEIDLSGKVKFLPIKDTNETIWAQTIHDELFAEKVQCTFSNKFRIENAAVFLENKYSELL